MNSLLVDLNVWLALSVEGHTHGERSRRWLDQLPFDSRLLMCRYTQLGVLRLLTNQTIMGDRTLTLRQAWAVYDTWIDDPRVEFCPEPRNLERSVRDVMSPFLSKPASKWVGDCYLLAYARESNATLVTFDKALHTLALQKGCDCVIPQ